MLHVGRGKDLGLAVFLDALAQGPRGAEFRLDLGTTALLEGLDHLAQGSLEAAGGVEGDRFGMDGKGHDEKGENERRVEKGFSAHDNTSEKFGFGDRIAGVEDPSRTAEAGGLSVAGKESIDVGTG